MKKLEIDQLAHLPEEEAIQKHYDAWNGAVLKWMRGVALVIVLAAMSELVAKGQMIPVIICILDLIVIFAFFVGLGSRFFSDNLTTLVISFIVVQYGVLFAFGGPEETVLIPSAVGFPLWHLLVRLRKREYLGLAAIYFAGGLWAVANRPDELGEPGVSLIEAAVILILTNVILFSLANLFARRSRTGFLKDWRRHVTRETERMRMREELADARKIQLAMLPESPPTLSWIDISSVSMPATEVGGDFYDYIELDEECLAIVIGDVAGHGVASGLVLAGIKSGLMLLKNELDHPVGAADKLNTMVRDWLRWRMLASMLVAVVDHASRTIRVVASGHPPLLHYSSSDAQVRTLGFGALPLGTRLPTNYREASAKIGEGDAFLLYTDGVTELSNFREDLYGEERLIQAFTRAAKEKTSRAIREVILDDLAHFKQDTTQQDDLSLVVARVRKVRGER